MKPLSSFTYYRRHKRQALLLAGLITLVTMGLFVMVSLFDSLSANLFTVHNSLTKFSLVTPTEDAMLDPGDASQIRLNPDVAHAIPVKLVYMQVPVLFASESFTMLGIGEADTPTLLNACGVRLKEGKLPGAHTNEIALSENIAMMSDLGLGDKIGRSNDVRLYGSIPTELEVVGILENDPATNPGKRLSLGLASLEYLTSHELYANRATGLLVIARDDRKPAVDEFLETTLRSARTGVQTYGELKSFFANAVVTLHLIFGTVDALVGLAMAGVTVVINQIALAQRLEEFGVLNAMGYDKRRLIRRAAQEVAVLAGIGFILGVALSLLIIGWLDVHYFRFKGIELNLAAMTPFAYTLPIPLIVVLLATLGIRRTFARFDAIAIVERGKLSLEAAERQGIKHSLAKPLSSWTFYLRHRRRGMLQIAAMTLMILGVAFPVFFISPIQNAQRPFSEHLKYASIVFPGIGNALDPGVTAEIKTHPGVVRTIPAMRLWLNVTIPPLTNTGLSIYGVSETDLPDLLRVYGAQLKEGHLPAARTNEIIVSETVAKNRGLHLGDKVGRTINEYDMPTEMTVAGILSADHQWLGFVSLEYLQSHKTYAANPAGLIVIPQEGRKTELDAWLEQQVASPQTAVETFETRMQEIQHSSQSMLWVFAALEGLIAVVAALALAVLNYIFFSQRQEEFGTLHALGRSRTWLVWRAVKEAAGVVAVAWLIGAGVCMAAMLYTQANLYAPRGLELDLLSLGPWLFTFPIPLAVIAASVGTIGWMLRKLDPVAVIERR